MKKRKIDCFIVFLVVALLFSGSILAADEAVFDTIMERIRANEWEEVADVPGLNKTVAGLVTSINADGSWSDLNYNSTVASNWPGTTHLNRLIDLSLAYTHPASAYNNDGKLYQKIITGLSFFYTRNPQSTNWFVHQIGNPQRLGRILILMRNGKEKVSASLETNILNRIKDTGSNPLTRTGANKVDIAIHWVYRGCLSADHQVLAHGVEQVFYPVFMTTQEGLQHDYAYFQHGQQLYTGGYGVSFVKHTVNLALCTMATEYELSGEKKSLLVAFFRDHFLSVIRGSTYMYNTVGRSIALSGGTGASYVADLVPKFKQADPENSDFYDAAIARLKNTKPAGYLVPEKHYHYWRGDYTLYTSPDYAFDVRMASTRTSRNENGNGQNLKGYFLTEGAYSMVLDGSEYRNIYSVWDWARIPGTTLPQKTTIPRPAQWETPGNAIFAGGVSNGKYGITTYHMENFDFNVNTEARKSWFMFGEEIVCLGAGIRSTAAEAINTTVNQCMQNGAAIVKHNEIETYFQIGASSVFSDKLDWIHHNKIAYFFPSGGSVNLSFATQTGSWYSIATTESTTETKSTVFKLWFNHGSKPNRGSYEYIIVPNKTLAQTRAYKVSDIVVAANTENIQVVYNKKLNVWGMVFYTASTFENENFSLSVDAPCVLMMEDPGLPTPKLWLADPSQNSSSIRINFTSGFTGRQEELTQQLPKFPYAGSTVELLLSSTSSVRRPGDVGNPSTNHLIPNPVEKGQTLSFQYHSATNQTCYIQVVDVTGKVVSTTRHDSKAGNNLVPIETSCLQKGNYFVGAVSNTTTSGYIQLIIK